MPELTDRQIQILKAVIEEFIETASPVGSETIERKYNLGVSPATIRNEMQKLADTGYLKQGYSSAGRSPTPTALKYYVQNLMKPNNLSVTDEVSAKEKVWDFRLDFEKLMREVTRELARRTQAIALSTVDTGDVYTAGAANILDMPEFYDIDLTKTILSLLEEFNYWQKLTEQGSETEDPIHLLLGNDLGMELLAPCGFVYTQYQIPPRHGAIGVIGPLRLNYSRVIPLVQYFGGLVSEIGKAK
ncbi:hypothetical protein FJZ40_00635 [Candidatus Shapirobacteria bacterium]|nr:hypothetical protein [Candidatus Shapirobacteria bacterium]